MRRRSSTTAAAAPAITTRPTTPHTRPLLEESEAAAEEEEEEAAEDTGAEETDWLSLELLSLLWLSEPDWLEKPEVLELLWPGRLDPLPDWLLETAPEPPWAVF